jgi:hypothetical protein
MRTSVSGAGEIARNPLTKIEPAESGGAPAEKGTDHLGSERDASKRLLTAFSKNPRGGAGIAQMEVGSDQFYDREYGK